MSERVRAAFRGQGHACAMLGSPFMGRLMPLIAARLAPTNDVARRVLDWPGDVNAAGQSVPLRVAAALHGLVLDNVDAGLMAAYPPNTVSDDALWDAVEAAFLAHAPRIMTWLDQAPQTNEVRRAAALIPAVWWALSHYDLPVTFLELGASGGLNLSMDRFALEIDGARHGPRDSPVVLRPDWAGPHPPARDLRVTGRAGVDLHPLDARDPDQALRLLAYLWPDQPDRMRQTRDAIDLSQGPPDQGDAAGWLADQLAPVRPGTLTIVYHSIAWQYFPAETQSRAQAALQSAGARATPQAPLAHIAMEAYGDANGAGLTGQVWPAQPGQEGPRKLARVDFHGRWVDWQT